MNSVASPRVNLTSDGSIKLKSVTSPPFRGDGTDVRGRSNVIASNYAGCLTRRSIPATPGHGSNNDTFVALELVGACFRHRRERIRNIVNAANSIENISLHPSCRRERDKFRRIAFVIRCNFV